MFVSSPCICVKLFLSKATVGIVLLQLHQGCSATGALPGGDLRAAVPALGTQGPDQRGHSLPWGGHWVSAGGEGGGKRKKN